LGQRTKDSIIREKTDREIGPQITFIAKKNWENSKKKKKDCGKYVVYV